MRRQLRWVVACSVVCALAVLPASAQRSLVIAGGVFEDRMSLAVRPHFLGAEGVTVKLYRGDRTPLATTKTSRAGMYVFQVAAPGDYVVTVDSSTLHPEAWPEQTFGPAGSLCAHPERGTITTLYEGPCFGGRTANGSDDASTLATAEHVAQVTVGESQTSVDFAFSFDVVTSTADAPRAQGTLRQYFLNANAKAGPNRMRFVPMSQAAEHPPATPGVPPRWWSIALGSPLPELRDDDTAVDGTPYNFVSPATPAQVHPGRFGEPASLQIRESQVSRLRRPELELIANGTAGIVCSGRCGLRGFALHGAQTGIITRADARIEHVLVGAAADGSPVAGGTHGVVVERGTLAARHLLVTSQTNTGIHVAREGRLDGERLDVSRCGNPLSGGGIVLLSNGSSIRSSMVATNAGAGIVVGAVQGGTPVTNNAIDGVTISRNNAGVVLAPGAARNVITRNDFMWNRLGGVTATPSGNLPLPSENRISANRFDENGLRPIVLDLRRDRPNAPDPSVGTCSGTPFLAAPQVTHVRITEENGIRAVIRGRACPGQIIELYQSFLTSTARNDTGSSAQVPEQENDFDARMSVSSTSRLRSIGEFNYLGATNSTPEGTFEASFSLPAVPEVPDGLDWQDEETDLWPSRVLMGTGLSGRSFAAIAIDAKGNTSEMSLRRRADQDARRHGATKNSNGGRSSFP